LADRDVIRSEIKRLVLDGMLLHGAEIVASRPSSEREKIANALLKVHEELSEFSDDASDGEEEEDKVSSAFKRLTKKPHFSVEYQNWYSPALRIVEQLLPDRYEEFREFYRPTRRKQTNVETYGIADYIAGMRITHTITGEPVFDAFSLAMGKFDQQIAIVGTAEDRLDSVLTDIGRTLHGEILDNELDAARNLLAASHIRSAGMVAGVALEGHLKKLIVDHSVPFRKKAMLSNLNDALKEAGVYDAPVWRQIQYLTDVRNLCGHKGERDPERAEVVSLIDGVAKITKTQF
jgi:hypothetical protein